MKKRWMCVVLAIALAGLTAAGAGGCAKDQRPAEGGQPLDAQPEPIRIGVLPTEDSLPLWVAEQQGLFEKAGITVEIVTFQAAQERDAAFASGSIDAYMGDIIASAALEAGGSPVSLVTVMLGATPQQGRFGIVAKPGSKAASLADVAGVPIGTSTASIQEYVVDKLMAGAGVPAAEVKKEVVPKVPVRLELLMSGKLEAAALPEPLLTLAEKQGAVLLADDTEGENITQTVLGVSDKYLAIPGGMVTVGRLLDVWDEAVDVVNADPDAWRGLLVEKARLPEPIKDTYAVNEYPKAQQPTEEMVAPVLEWMRQKGLLKTDLAYADLVQDIPR
ncbi:MAG: MetQ/NlpA family ABC transporter substrate-binding protein [Anaerosomatales bacterium]|nr:MetQ/NlpA family ABC transporter substrate-binding protein [Anaerosomatales bacterium]